MLDFFSFLRLNLAVLFALFIPGWLVLAYFFKKESFDWLEKIVLSLGLSLFSIDFFFILINKLGIKFSSGTIFFVSLCFFSLIFYFFQKKKASATIETKPFSPKIAFWLLLLSAILFRTVYLSDKVVPSSTDLGHHMYWAKSIVTFNQLPNYGMPDFIIGEHIIFAFISFLSGWDLVSVFPMALIFIFNIFSLLAFYLLVRKAVSFWDKEAAQQVANLALLTGGVLYAFSSPQTSFVSGGVIGNILGNFFIPLILFLFLSAREKKNKNLALLTVLLSAGLVYTHHLSSYILLFVLLFFLAFLWLNDFGQLFSKEKNFLFFSKDFFKTFFSLKVIMALLFFAAFIFLIDPPSYLNKSAIDVAVGDPSKSTRTGYEWLEMKQTLGDWRFANSLVGFGLLVGLVILSFLPFEKIRTLKETFFSKEKKVLFPIFLSIAWGISIFLMSWAPEWLKTDIPSRRIVSYLTWPTAFLASLGLFFFFYLIKANFQKRIGFLSFAIILSAGFFSSNRESLPYFLSNTDNSEAYQTFAAAQYLNTVSQPEEKILKDHIYLKGDTWVKLFLMRGYNEPLSRSNLSRYDDPTKPRETCTRDIIANPNNETGRKCLEETNVKFVLLQKNQGDQNFEKSPNWSKIFSNQKAVIFFLDDND